MGPMWTPGPSIRNTSSNSGFLLASEADSHFPIRSVPEGASVVHDPGAPAYKNVVQVATNHRKFRNGKRTKGRKTVAGFCYNLLLFSGLRRLRQDLANAVFRLQTRCSPT